MIPIKKYIALIVFGSAELAACLWLGGCHKATSQNGNGENGAVRAAAVAQVEQIPLTAVLSVAGEFLPYQETELHAKVAGYIRKINVDIGDRVKTGQVIAILEVPELTADVQGAAARVRHSQEEIGRAESDLQRVQADHAALHAAAERLQQAAAARPGLVAQQELDDATAKDRAAEAQVQVARATLAAARQQVEVSKADLSHYSSLADYSHITAPFSGIVTWRYADTGALIQAGTSNAGSMPVVKVAEIDKLRLRLPVPESLAANVHQGDAADVFVQATGEHLSGKIIRETGSLDPATRTEQVEVDVENRNHKLTPGMYAEVRLTVESSANTLSVPVQAIAREAGTASVYIIDSGNRVGKRTVQTGIETANRVEIRSGLNAGERVIVGNLSAYQDGQRVTPTATKVSGEGEEQ